MKLSIVMPVYNEAQTVKEMIERVRRVSIEKEIIIVDDSSKDGTKDILKEINKKYPDIKVVYSDPNRGKGYAIKYGFKFVTGDIILIQDADLEYNPTDYYKIMEAYLTQNADVVYGSRFLGTCENMIFLQLLANKFFTLLTNCIHRSHLTDVCTCYKSFKTDIIKQIPLESPGFGICHEINAKLLRSYKVVEVPINYYARRRSEGKKVGLKEFFTTFGAIVKFGFTS